MPSADLILLHAPTVYDFRRRATLWGPTSDLVPSEPVFDMYPVGFSTMAAYLEQAGFRLYMLYSAHYPTDLILPSAACGHQLLHIKRAVE